MSLHRLRYEIRLMGKSVVLTPAVIMISFALFAIFLHSVHENPSRFLLGGLEMVLPIAVGVVVGTIATHDSALELQLTLPSLYSGTAMRRLFIIIGWTMCVALFFNSLFFTLNLGYIPQQIHSWAAPLQFLVQQLAWFAPLLWCASVCFCFTLFFRSRSAGAALLAGIWIVEVIFYGFFVAINWLRPVFLFPTTLAPTVDFWLANRFEISGTGVVLMLLGWFLLGNTEGLLKGSSEE